MYLYTFVFFLFLCNNDCFFYVVLHICSLVVYIYSFSALFFDKKLTFLHYNRFNSCILFEKTEYSYNFATALRI